MYLISNLVNGGNVLSIYVAKINAQISCAVSGSLFPYICKNRFSHDAAQIILFQHAVTVTVLNWGMYKNQKSSLTYLIVKIYKTSEFRFSPCNL